MLRQLVRTCSNSRLLIMSLFPFPFSKIPLAFTSSSEPYLGFCASQINYSFGSQINAVTSQVGPPFFRLMSCLPAKSHPPSQAISLRQTPSHSEHFAVISISTLAALHWEISYLAVSYTRSWDPREQEHLFFSQPDIY